MKLNAIQRICAKFILYEWRKYLNKQKSKKNISDSTNDNIVANIQIPDCFVDPILKLNKGKDGHGERRLYSGNCRQINEHICTKPWLIKYNNIYKHEIKDYIIDDNNFSKTCENRYDVILKCINICENILIHVVQQNGKTDVRRYYIGPDKNDKENIKRYDMFRKTIIPKLYHIQLLEAHDCFICKIINNKNVVLLNDHKKITSKVSIEFLKFKSAELHIEIQHIDNGGEFKLRNPDNGYFWPVDGYHNCEIHTCSGNKNNPCLYNNYIWEFQGDYYHGNPTKYISSDKFHDVSYDTKHKKDLAKKTFYEKNGYVVNIKWEGEWVKEKKLMKQNGFSW